MTDPLTGLADRASFLSRLDVAAAESRPGHLPAVVVDLVDFTAVNDGCSWPTPHC